MTGSVPILHYKGASGVVVDVNRLIASRFLTVANSGGGKSRAVRQLLEETHGHVQHLVLDPEGEFATLREKFDYVLAAGRGGDVQASPKTAKLLCRRLMELGASAVIDLYDLSLNDRREFVKLFLLELMSLPRDLWRPLLVVIDEAHVFAPERGSGESQSTEAVISLCTQGRKRGYCAVLATQRISKLHKDAAAELLNKLIGRTGLDVDVKRAGEELGFDKEERQQLKRLEPGQFFVYGPAIANEIQKVWTADVKTTHPEIGGAAATPPPPSAKVRAMLAAQLAELPKEAEEEARTVADYKRLTSELTRKLKHAEKSAIEKIVERKVVDQGAIDRAVRDSVRGIQAKQKELLRTVNGVARSLEKTCKALQAGVRELEPIAAAVAGLPEQLVESVVEDPALRTLDAPAREPAAIHLTSSRSRTATTSTTAASYESDRAVIADGLNAGERKILNAIAELKALGTHPASRPQVGIVAGYNLSGGTPAQYVKSLLDRVLIVIPSPGQLGLTRAGEESASSANPPDTLDELHERVFSRLNTGEAKILRHLVEIHPEAQTRSQVGQAVGYNLSGGTPAQYVSKLLTLDFATSPRPGELRASDFLFPEALR